MSQQVQMATIELTIPPDVRKSYSLDVAKIPVVQAIDRLRDKTVIIPEDMPEAQIVGIRHLLYGWGIGLDWVLKHQTKAWRARDKPFNTDRYRLREGFGDLLNAKFEACYGIFEAIADFHPIELEYEKFTDLWVNLVEEERAWELNSNVQDDYVAQMRQKMKSIRQGINAFDGDTNWRHHFNFVEIGLSIARHQPNENNRLRQARKRFREGCWSEYLSCWKTWLTQLESKETKYMIVDPDTPYIYRNTKRQAGKPAREILWEPSTITL